MLQPLLGGNELDLVVGIDGLDTGDYATFLKGNINNYGVSSPVGDIVATSIDVQSNEGMWNGKS